MPDYFYVYTGMLPASGPWTEWEEVVAPIPAMIGSTRVVVTSNLLLFEPGTEIVLPEQIYRFVEYGDIAVLVEDGRWLTFISHAERRDTDVIALLAEFARETRFTK